MKSAKVNARCLDCGTHWPAQYASVDQGIRTDSPGPCPYCHWPDDEVRTEWIEKEPERKTIRFECPGCEIVLYMDEPGQVWCPCGRVTSYPITETPSSPTQSELTQVDASPEVLAVIKDLKFYPAAAVRNIACANTESVSHDLRRLRMAARYIQLEIERLS